MNDKNFLVIVFVLVILIACALFLKKDERTKINYKVIGETSGIIIREIDDKYICFTYFNRGISCLRKEDK
jgi:hypothetical protein